MRDTQTAAAMRVRATTTIARRESRSQRPRGMESGAREFVGPLLKQRVGRACLVSDAISGVQHGFQFIRCEREGPLS
jgi:hypothetical protein